MRIGLDPEVAIINKDTGLAMSAHKFITEPEQYTFYRDNDKSKTAGRVGSEAERDGCAIEVRSVIPSACRDNIIPYVAEALRQQSLRLEREHPGFKLSSQPVFTLADGETEGDDVPEDVFEFGCREDWNAYSLEPKSPVLEAGDMGRYTGGHVHYSTMFARNNIEQQAAIAVLYDYFVAMPFVAILGEKFADGEAARREFYGQPGSFRYDDTLDKIEFRTLSGRLLLHPTLMYWVLGMMKTINSAVNLTYNAEGKSERDWRGFLKTLQKALPAERVFDTVSTHNIDNALKYGHEVFKLLPSYKEDPSCLANPMSGGGAGTTNPYFFEQSWRVFVESHNDDAFYGDDMKFNWGLYEDYAPKHHAYWGIQQSMVGLCDDAIFPMRRALERVWPKEHLQTKPVYTHPLNGGAMQYVTPGAINWLA